MLYLPEESPDFKTENKPFSHDPFPQSAIAVADGSALEGRLLEVLLLEGVRDFCGPLNRGSLTASIVSATAQRAIPPTVYVVGSAEG